MRVAPTACAGTAVRRFGDAVIARDVVDHHGAGANARGDFLAAIRVAGPDTGAQAERRVVCERDGFLGAYDGLDRDHGTERFLAHELHGVVHTRDDRRLEKILTEIWSAITAC